MSIPTPEVRQNTMNALTRDFTAYMETTHKAYFGTDNSTASRQLMVEAVGKALCNWARGRPEPSATLLTFVREMQDNIEV